MTQPTMLLLYCRAGFEGEAAAEIQERTTAIGVFGYCKAKPDTGYVLFVPHEPSTAPWLTRELPFDELIFPRQMLAAWPVLDNLPVTDRVEPLQQTLAGQVFSDVLVEYPDTNEGKQLAAFCRKFHAPFTAGLRRRGMLRDDPSLPRLHLFFLSSTCVYPALGWPNNASPWPLGIPRLKFPGGAPSRSTLKLEEAFLHFLSEGERELRLRPGSRAVDLGAAPGGWTYQLVRRSIRVTAVDNGPMDATLMDSGLVEHRREDGFRYRPAKPVDWLVCDMVEKPVRIARLVAEWIRQGLCREAIFNLKLPMKKRWQEVQRCDGILRDALEERGMPYRLRYKQLYHDREEITAHLLVKR